jgi:kynurenine formamidase
MKPFPFRLVDLSHTLDSNSPTWDGGCGFKHEVEIDYHTNPQETAFSCHEAQDACWHWHSYGCSESLSSWGKVHP